MQSCILEKPLYCMNKCRFLFNLGYFLLELIVLFLWMNFTLCGLVSVKLLSDLIVLYVFFANTAFQTTEEKA